MKGFTVGEFLIALGIAALIATVTLLTWIGAEHKASVWNRCHPSVPITTTEAWFIDDLQLDECDIGDDHESQP